MPSYFRTAQLSVRVLCESEPSAQQTKRAVYGSDFYAGMPALTVNDFGAGQATIIAGVQSRRFWTIFIRS
jgi:beta-galactosidase